MLFASVGIALSEAEKAERSAAQVSFFGDSSEEAGHTLVAAREWTEAERLVHEKAALGFYLSGHPYAAFAQELAPLIRLPLSELQPRKEPALIAGIVMSVRVQSSRRGKMAIVTLDDGGAAVEVVVYNEIYDAASNALREDQLVIFEAKILQRTRRRRTGAGPAHRGGRRARSSPRCANATRRSCASPATAAPTPRGSRKC